MSKAILRAAKIDRLRAELPERCECGVRLDVHPPLPRPLPWSHGRPCGREREGVRVFSRGWRSAPLEDGL